MFLKPLLTKRLDNFWKIFLQLLQCCYAKLISFILPSFSIVQCSKKYGSKQVDRNMTDPISITQSVSLNVTFKSKKTKGKTKTKSYISVNSKFSVGLDQVLDSSI